jgi:hypothetical protein
MVARAALPFVALPSLLFAGSVAGVDLDRNPEYRFGACIPWAVLIAVSMLARNLVLLLLAVAGFFVVAVVPGDMWWLIALPWIASLVMWTKRIGADFYPATFIVSVLAIFVTMLGSDLLLNGIPRGHKLLENATAIADTVYAVVVVLGALFLPAPVLPWVIVLGVAGLVNWAVEDFCIFTALAEWIRSGSVVYADRDNHKHLNVGKHLNTSLGIKASPKIIHVSVWTVSILVAVVRYVRYVKSKKQLCSE